MVVRGGSVRGCVVGLEASHGGKAVAEGAVLEARPLRGQQSNVPAMAVDPGTTLVLRRCQLCMAASASPPPGGEANHSLLVGEGARATVADSTCSGAVLVMGAGSSLLHSGLAYALDLDDPVSGLHSGPPLVAGLPPPIIALDGGVACELQGAAGGLAGPRGWVAAHPAGPPEAGGHGAGPESGSQSGSSGGSDGEGEEDDLWGLGGGVLSALGGMGLSPPAGTPQPEQPPAMLDWPLPGCDAGSLNDLCSARAVAVLARAAGAAGGGVALNLSGHTLVARGGSKAGPLHVLGARGPPLGLRSLALRDGTLVLRPSMGLAFVSDHEPLAVLLERVKLTRPVPGAAGSGAGGRAPPRTPGASEHQMLSFMGPEVSGRMVACRVELSPGGRVSASKPQVTGGVCLVLSFQWQARGAGTMCPSVFNMQRCFDSLPSLTSPPRPPACLPTACPASAETRPCEVLPPSLGCLPWLPAC